MKELKVTPIKNGTVIDHIDPGMALKVLKIPNMLKKDWMYGAKHLKVLNTRYTWELPVLMAWLRDSG